MNIPAGTRVGLCDHVPDYPARTDGMVLEVTTDAGKIVVLICARCWLRYASDGDLAPLVTRQVVTGRAGWDLKVEVDMVVPS